MINTEIKRKGEKEEERYPLLVILGPTAVGKTELSIKLAKKLNGEIISADSMQVYQEMDIGTAKASPQIRKKISHHLIDIISPEEEFSVADFQNQVDYIIPKICERDKIPMLVGGTGLYIKAVVAGFLLPEMTPNEKLREKLRKKADKYGNKYVHNILAEIDPDLARKLHPNDLRRVIRGIEIYRQTGKTKTYFKKKQAKAPLRYQTLKIGLKRKRKELYNRINARIDEMIEEGLIEEVKYLYSTYDLSETALQGLGYKEIIKYIRNRCSLEEAIYQLKRDTRHFAKRQLTWFRRDKDIYWFDLSKLDHKIITERVIQLFNEKLAD